MTPTFSVCLLLIVAGAALGQEETSRSHPSSTGEEWTEERIDALLEELKHGRQLNVFMEEIELNTHLYNKYVKENDCDGILKLYDPNFMLINQDGTMATGLEAIQLILEVLDSLATLNLSTLSATPLDKDARFVFQHVHSEARDSDGNPIFTGGAFHVWKRDVNNKLRIAMEIFDEGSVTIHGKP